MKSSRRGLLGVIAIAFAAASVLAAMPDVDIQVVPRKIEASQPQNKGHRTVSEENWNYEVTVENRRFQPLMALEVRYMIFYTAAELGSKDAAQQQHESGDFKIDALQPHEKKTFTTNTVQLNKSHLVGRRHYINGRRMKAEDALVGVWVRVFQGGQQVGEYANPSILMKEQWQ